MRYAMLTLSKMCYNCMEAQVSREAINEETYWKDGKQFIREERPNGGWPEYWTSAKSITDTESNLVSAIQIFSALV